MKIDGITGSDQTLPPEQAHDRQLRKACQDFEAIFTGFMLKSMRKTVVKNDLFGSNKEEEMFRDMMDDEICKNASATGSMGIADMLYKQLSDQIRQQTQNETRGDNR